MEKLNVLVIGMGLSGISVAKMIERQGNNVFYYDDSKEVSEFRRVRYLDDIDFCIISPGVSPTHEYVQKVKDQNIKIYSELEYACNKMTNDYIAITGTNGKTTTTLLVEQILKNAGINAQAMGNIGIPVSEKVLDMGKDDVAVIEVSSFQMETTTYFNPKIAGIINLSKDHLDRHKSYEEYLKCKLRMFKNLTKSSKAVINYDDDYLKEFSLTLPCEVTYFSKKYKVKGCYLNKDKIYYKEQYVCDITDISMKEAHNIENILCALAICLPLNIPVELARKTIMTYMPPKYRMENKGYYDEILYINDSKGTNIASTISACKSTIGLTALIMGGSDKGEDFDEFFANLPFNIKCIFVCGENDEKILASAKRANYTEIYICNSLTDCIYGAREMNIDTILFSPASASFDRYTSYIERGELFDKLIQE